MQNLTWHKLKKVMLNRHDQLVVKFGFQLLNMKALFDFKLIERGGTINNFETRDMDIKLPFPNSSH